MGLASLTLSGLLLASCGAPASRPAGGDVATAVAAAMEHGRGRFDHTAWDRLLRQAVDHDLVNYTLLQERRPDLVDYLARVAAADMGSLEAGELKAFLCNAYNALTVRSILDHPRVASIREIDGVWTSTRHRVGGFELTLDQIEHNLLRPFFRDPRIHFAVNCASRSCAPLPGWAFTGPSLDLQLEERTRAFLSDPRQVEIRNGTLMVSSYFEWYGDDFTAPGWEPRAATIPLFIAGYATPEVSSFIGAAGSRLPLGFLAYDWSLNAAVPPDPQVMPPAPGSEAASGKPADTPQEDGVVTRLRDRITRLGPAGFVLYGLAYVLLTVFFIPAWPMTVGAGAAYGLLAGTILTSVSSVAGAAVAFLVARYLLRARVARWVAGSTQFAAIDRAVGREGWKIVALTRSSPVFPFNLQNYAYGLTAIGFWPYVFASWAAMLPGTLLYVYIGATGADVAEAATGQVDWLVTGFKWAGFAATLLVTLYIARVARRALKGAAAADTSPA
jgi:uncharacterized membrane protein YdjX (TVP38/TMEM64 family)